MGMQVWVPTRLAKQLMEIVEMVVTIRLVKQLMEILELVTIRLVKPTTPQPPIQTIPRSRLMKLHVHDDAADTADAALVDTLDQPPLTDTSDSPSLDANTPPPEDTLHCNTATAVEEEQTNPRIPSTNNDGTHLDQGLDQNQDHGLDPIPRIAEMLMGPRDAESQTVKSRSRALTRLRDAFTSTSIAISTKPQLASHPP